MILNLIKTCLLCMALLFAVSCPAAAEDDIAAQRSCSHCGMDRKAYGYSRMVLVYEDGATSGVCSLHCAATEMRAAGGRKLKTLLVADRDSRELIAAREAVWVIGGSKRGVMTQRPKWAFASKKGAEAFIARYGGSLADWETVFAAAGEETVPKPR